MLYPYPMPPGSFQGMQGYPPYPYPGAMMPGMPMMPPLSSKAEGKTKRRRKNKHAKAEGAPKKPATSFVMFSNAQREQVKEEHPGLNFIDVGKKLGEMWREMDPVLKKQWEERATTAKDQYLEAKKRWLEERSMQTGLFSAGAE